MAVRSKGGSATIQRAYDEAAPNSPDFGDVSVQLALGIWYVKVTKIPTIPTPIDQARLVVSRVVGGVAIAPYTTPVVTLSPLEWVECGLAPDALVATETVIGIQSVVEVLIGQPVRVRDVTTGTTPPIETTAVVDWTLTTGDDPGELVVTVNSITNGSGPNGAPTHVDFSLNGAEFEVLGTGALAVGAYSIITTPSANSAVVLQWRNSAKTFPYSDPQTALAGEEDDPDPVLPVWHLPQPQSFTAGGTFSADWTTYCTGATSFAVTQHLTGGVSSGTGNKLYNVASLVAQVVDLTVVATNADGTSIGIWTITVESAILKPSVVRPVADQSLVNGDTLLIKLDGPTGVFSGTEPITFNVTPASDADFVLNTTAHTFGNPNPLVSSRASFPVTLTATNSAGAASEPFNIAVSIVRGAALEWNDDVTMGAAQNLYTDWRAGVVSRPSGSGTLVWTRSTPDANDTVPPTETEEFESLGSGQYRTRMTDSLKRGNPDVQTAVVTLGSGPITTTANSNNIVIAKTAHGMGVGRRVTLANAPALNGLTAAQINGTRQIIAVTANNFTVQAGANATSGSAGGGTGITYTANRADYSVFAPGEPANIRVAYNDGAVISHWSLPMAIPQVVSIGARYWRFNSRRLQASYEAVPPWGGSIGNQYQHVVTFNLGGKRDPAKKYYMFLGQDENSVSFSPDGGRTISPVVGLGLWCTAGMVGLYYNSDDLATGLLLAMGGGGFGSARTGLYGSVDDGRTFKRIRLNRTAGADCFASNYTYFPRLTMNLISRRPQNAAGTLTDAERPIYVVAQQKDSGGTFTGCYLFKWDGGNIFSTADWTQVYEWPVASIRGTSPTIGDEVGMTFIKVAPNGDVIVGGRQGLWLSINGGDSFTKEFTGCVRGLAVDMTASGVSGCAIAISNKAGANDPVVLKTGNIRTTAFTGAGNTGLPTNSTAIGFYGTESNFNRMYLVYKSGSAYYARLSTNGGGAWNAINVKAPPGYDTSAEKWRYSWGGGRGPTIYPHPTDLNHVFGMVFISGAVSTDGGANFDGKACSYFDHAHGKGWGYDRNDFRKLYQMLQDSGSFYQNGTKWYDETGLKWDLVVNNQAGASATVLKHAQNVGGEVKANRTQGRGACSLHGSALTLFTFSADGVNNKCIPVIRNGAGTWVARTDVGHSRCAKFFHHPTVSGTIVMGKWFITGWGTTAASVDFTSYSNREVLGYSMVSGSPVWYFGGAGNASSTIYRAPNSNGSGGTLWKTVASSAEHTAYAVDYHNDGTVFVSRTNQAGKIERHTAGGSTVIFDAKAEVDAVHAAYGISTTNMAAVVVEHLITDPNMEGLLYAVLDVAGLPVMFMTTNANAGSPSWTNETRNLPHSYHWMPNLHPVTGEICVLSSMGEYWLPAPSGYPALTNLNYFTKEMDAFYGRADVPDPPILSGV